MYGYLLILKKIHLKSLMKINFADDQILCGSCMDMS